MKYYASVTIPMKGQFCGGQFCGLNVKGYYTVWKVIVYQYCDGSMKIGTPKIFRFNQTREEAIAICERAQVYGALVLSDSVFEGEGMTQSEFYKNVVDNIDWSIDWIIKAGE